MGWISLAYIEHSLVQGSFTHRSIPALKLRCNAATPRLGFISYLDSCCHYARCGQGE